MKLIHQLETTEPAPSALSSLQAENNSFKRRLRLRFPLFSPDNVSILNQSNLICRRVLGGGHGLHVPLPAGGRLAVTMDAVPGPNRLPRARHAGCVEIVHVI